MLCKVFYSETNEKKKNRKENERQRKTGRIKEENEKVK